MDNRPIGVFDSGLGGLTTVREMMRVLPGESVIYFGDTGRIPYGTRSSDTIRKYASQDMRFLRTFDIKAIVAACGTVSTTVLDALAPEVPLPVLGVVEPAARRAAELTGTGSIGLIGTQASVKSGTYERYIKKYRGDAEVMAIACPLFVPIVENGHFSAGDPVAALLIEEYLAPMKEKGVDTLVLGCTHYVLLEDAIREYMGGSVSLINPGAEAARAAARLLESGDAFAESGSEKTLRYFVSDSPEDFSKYASLFLGIDGVECSADKVDIENY